MTSLTITRGLPGSGKTTWARTRPGWRVNRDDLRAMVRPAPWPYGDRDAEAALTRAQDAAITALLLAGIDVISDDTNLRDADEDRLRTLAWRAGADVMVYDLRWMDVGLCIARDAGRTTGRVGADIIRRMHAEHIATADQR